jgi:exopolysaccharide production protein ExoZ
MPTRINNVQALRGFAALLVVIGHTEFALPGLHPFGVFGVDIFFVISGYIMAMICDRNPEKFFLRRLIRIVPLYWAATLLVYALAVYAPAMMQTTRPDWRELVMSLLFIPFYKSANNAAPILNVGWTLNYEMFFYVVLALCLQVSRRWATALASVVIVASIVAAQPLSNHFAFVMQMKDWIRLEFVFGIVAYALVRRVPQTKARQLRVAALVIVIAAGVLLCAVQAVPLWGRFHEWRMLRFGLLAFVLVASASLLTKGGADTRSKLLVLLGDASYVTYIGHVYVLDGFDRLVARRYPVFHIATAVGCVTSVALVLVVSVLIYQYAERPTVDWLAEKLGTRKIRKAEADPAATMA